MDVAPRPGSDATGLQPTSIVSPARGRGRIPPPPFNAGGLKRNALDHIRSYRRFFNSSQWARIDLHAAEGPSGTTDIGKHSTKKQAEDPIVKRKVIQGMLMTDLQRLLAGIDRLERSLRRGRYPRWLVNGTLAALWNAIVINYIPAPKRDSYGSHILHSSYIATGAYLLSLPLFGYPILNYERQLSCTVAVKEGLMDLYGLVRKGAVLDDADISCLTDSQWDVVPWSKVETDV
ncbi:uncharacterized protein A1O5_02851 [Cladophialophora psammophila CBS 110553]|uniref:Uncharacterized protein n=1 Tax=Cladophialophora psammophila CBS 110553 TaxID=1182543 RepID=W9XB56_9EURO|nr:uncharacterized protein A1O5_02851 [Cladophialophora psammophila CBS 110553]EXJ74555.1 hypothetical protein A1O5_02851 [Cladophialophora psammophila CBS 110553]